VEGEILLHILDVGIGNEGGMGKIPFALAALALEQVPGALFPAQNLTGSCHLEPLGNSLSGLCFS
jgi:hypothetical protein